MKNIDRVAENLKRETEILRRIASETRNDEILRLCEEYQAIKDETDRMMNE